MKQQIRNDMKRRRLALGRELHAYASKQIIDALAPYLNEAKVVASYMPIQNEVDLRNLNGSFQLIYPKVTSATTMEMVLPDSFKQGAFGILEPEGKSISRKEIDVILVPLLAFDDAGYRLGYGNGYYDRYLHDYSGLRIGIAFELQKVESVFPNQYDQRLDCVITEKQIYLFK